MESRGGSVQMAYEPVEKLGDRRIANPAATHVASPFGTDRYDRAQPRPEGAAPGDRLSLSGAASHRIQPISNVHASDTAHLGVHGRDLAAIARGELSYESWLTEKSAS